MNTKQIEELKKKYPLIEVPNIDWIRQQTAKEIIEMLETDIKNGAWLQHDYIPLELIMDIKSKYGIGE